MNTKLLTMATVAGLSIGGLGSVAVAQGYGDAPVPAVAVESDDASVETSDQGQRSAPVAAFQDLDTEADTDAGAEAEAEGDNEGRRGHRGGCNLEEAAAAIGIDEADLSAALESGDTIADVAEANGVDASVVIDAMVDAKSERIADKVEDGRITQDEADEKLAEVESRITDRVNGVEDAA